MDKTFGIKELNEWKSLGYIPKDGWLFFGNNHMIGTSKDPLEGMFKFIDTCKEMLKFQDVGLVSSLSINEITLNLLRTILPSNSRILQEIISGKINVALCITEESEGSNILGNKLEAKSIDPEHYTLNGKKVFISNAIIADYLIVVAKTNNSSAGWQNLSLFLIPSKTEGIEISERKSEFLKLMPVSEIKFENCIIPTSYILGRKNRGFFYLVEALQFERLILSVLSIEICKYALNETLTYVKQRETFYKKLSDYQVVRFNLAQFYAKMEILSDYNTQLIKKFNIGKADKTKIIIAKTMSTEFAVEFSIYLSQLYGGKGYLKDSWMSNFYNDIRWMGIAGGSNEVLLDVLSNGLINGCKI